MAKKKKGLENLTPALVVVSVILAFAVGILWQRVDSLENGDTSTSRVAGQQAAAGNAGGAAQQQPQQQGPTQGKMEAEGVQNIPQITAEDHVRGAENPQVYLIEYSDYECPFCSRFHPTAQQVVDEYGDRVAWVYRHFPLDQLHPQARPAAEASECVAELGGEEAFWAFTDALFEDQSQLSNLEEVAVGVGVNSAAFVECVESDRHAENIEEEYQAGVGAGVRGTPGNFVVTADWEQGWFMPGAFPFSQFQTAIDEALQS